MPQSKRIPSFQAIESMFSKNAKTTSSTKRVPTSTETKCKQLKITDYCISKPKNPDNILPKETISERKTNSSNESKAALKHTSRSKETLQHKSAGNFKLSSNRKHTFKRNSSGSFDKYGVILPNFQDVLDSHKQAEYDKLIIEDLTNTMSFPLEEVDFTLPEIEQPETVLDCKHLTDEQLLQLFKSNLKYLKAIILGTSHSKRHKQYLKQNFTDNFTTKDLKFNTSMITFTSEQKQQLLNYLHQQFSSEKLCKNEQYFFKVLLPELCLKIFMDVHNMSKKVATSYLDERPVELII